MEVRERPPGEIAAYILVGSPSGRPADVQNCSRQFCRTGATPRSSYLTPDTPSIKKPTDWVGLFMNGAPGEIRTPDHLVRSQVLYPTELRALNLYLRLNLNRFNLRFHFYYPLVFPGEIIPGILPSTLRAVLRTFKIAPGNFVELPTTWFEARYSIQLSYGHLLGRAQNIYIGCGHIN